jgi:hypothetical protein
VLSKEWDSIRSLNLGVKSGTGVIEDVLITQLQQLANTVHVLAVADEEASRVLVQQARRLSTQQFQHLQVSACCAGHCRRPKRVKPPRE